MGEIKTQGLYNGIITYFGILLGFVSILLVQPFLLSTEEIGLTRILYSFSIIVSTIIPLGIINVTIRYFPFFRNREKKHSGFMGFMLLFPIVGLTIVGIILFIFRQNFIEQYQTHSRLFADYFNYVLPFSFILALISIFNHYAYSLFKTNFPSVLNDIFTRVVFIALIAVYYWKWISLETFVFLFVVIYAFQLILLIAYLFVIDKPTLAIEKAAFPMEKLKEMINYSIVFSLAMLASLGMKFLDMVMLGKYLNLELVGIYAVAAFIPTVIEAPSNALEKISATKMSDALAFNRMEEIRRIYYQSTQYLALIGGLLCIGIVVNIESLLMLLPNDFAGGLNVVYILSAGTFFNMVTGLNGPILMNSKHYKTGVILLLSMFVFSFFAYQVFIPLWGLEGAAFGTVLSGFLFNLAKYLFIWKKMGMQPFDWKIMKILLLFVVTLLLFFPDFISLSPIVSILLKSILITVFFITCVYFLKISPELFNLNEIKKLGNLFKFSNKK